MGRAAYLPQDEKIEVSQSRQWRENSREILIAEEAMMWAVKHIAGESQSGRAAIEISPARGLLRFKDRSILDNLSLQVEHLRFSPALVRCSDIKS